MVQKITQIELQSKGSGQPPVTSQINGKSSEYNVFIASNVPESKTWVAVSNEKLDSKLHQNISKIDVSELKFDKVLGNGSFGEVWKGSWRGLIVAIKQVKQEIIDEKSKYDSIPFVFKFLINC